MRKFKKKRKAPKTKNVRKEEVLAFYLFLYATTLGHDHTVINR